GPAAPFRRAPVAPPQEAQAADQGRHHPVADATGAGRAGLMPATGGDPRFGAAVAAAFEADGPLARAQPGYALRPGQREMALAIAAAIAAAGDPAKTADSSGADVLVAE